MLRFLTLVSLIVGGPLGQGTDPWASILEALQLPALVTEARRAGVSEASVREVLDALGRRGLPAADAALVVREEVDAVHAGAPKDNFGGFVQRQLALGLRGRALAEAIRAEHRARGIGRPEGRPPQGRDLPKPKRSKP